MIDGLLKLSGRQGEREFGCEDLVEDLTRAL